MVRFADAGVMDGGYADEDGGHAHEDGGHADGPLLPDETPVARLERVGGEVAELAAHIDAATYRFLVRLRDFDRLFDEAGGAMGFASCAAWLGWRIGVAPGTAREKVRVARALGGLPKISAAMERGRLSYSQVRSLTRIADAENEDRLLTFAEHSTAAQLETLVRGWRTMDRQAETEAARERHDRRALSVQPAEDGSYVVRGRLDPEAGVMMRKALELISEALYRSERSQQAAPGPERPRQAQRWADAAGIMAETILRIGFGSDAGAAELVAEEPGAEEPGAEELVAEERASPPPEGGASPPDDLPITLGRGDRYQVVVHVDAATLFGGGDSGGCGDSDGECAFADGGVRVPAETLARIGCDAGFVAVLHDEEGGILDVGRRRRLPTTSQRRALAHRDRSCQFPGCDHARFLVPHHIVDWCPYCTS